MKILLNILQYIFLISGVSLLVIADWRIAVGIGLLTANVTLGLARSKVGL